MKPVLFFLFICLTVTAGATSFTPPEIPGWKQEGDVETFSGDNLYNHINGASEFYFSYNFKQLWVVRYQKGDAEIAMEVYDHGDPVHAYGIYSMERPGGAKVAGIGGQGYFEEDILNFVAGQYYVKMFAFREPGAGGGVLLATAKQLSPTLEKNPRLPAIVDAIPAENLAPNSIQYISNTFMGLELLGSAFRASYETAGGKLTLFVMERESPDEVALLLKKYYEFAKSEPGELKEGTYRLEDPFNGTIHLNWTGNYLIGFSGDDLPAEREALLRSVVSKLN